MKIGLALGSGAVRGYSHIPIIQRLVKEGIKFDYIAGTSIGSIMGAYYCLNKEFDSMFKILRNMKKRDFIKLVDLNNPKISIVKGETIKKFLIDNYFGKKTFRDVQVPFVICASNLSTKKPQYFEKGKLIDAIMASVSMPGIFPPYKIKEDLFVDGALFHQVPIDILFKKGMDKVIAVNLNTYDLHVEKNHNAFNVLTTAFGILMCDSTQRSLNKNVFLLEPKFTEGFADSLKLYDWKEYKEPGKKEINAKIKDLKKWLRNK